jgi:S1-C subfamily serine protease
VANVPKPNPAILRTRGVQAAAGSVVRIVGTACGLGVEGSGWVAAPGLVVTNAHVVAGETDTTVQLAGHPPGLAAHAVDFDPHDDIAILRVPGLSAPALTMAPSTPPGTSVGILGFPLDGPFDAEPGRIGATQTVSTEDAYGNGPVTRSITSLRGLVRPGNSGGPMIDTAGHVAATVFAAITSGNGRKPGGFAVPNGLVRTQLDQARARGKLVGTGHCAS